MGPDRSSLSESPATRAKCPSRPAMALSKDASARRFLLAEEAIKKAIKDYYDKNGISYDHSLFPDCENCAHCGA